MRRREFIKGLGAGGLACLVAGCGDDQGQPQTQRPVVSAEGSTPREIRLAPHGTWGSKKATGVMGIVQEHGYLEEEFAEEGTQITWSPMDGGGIEINEAIANGLVDCSMFGAFPQIIGQARGLRTRILASQGYAYNYLAVRRGLDIDSPAQLRGKVLAVSFGAHTHHTTGLMLAEHGVGLAEVKLLNLSAGDAIAALASGRVDAVLAGPQLFALEEQDLVRIIYFTAGRRTQASAFGGLFVTEDFHQRYPDASRRLLKCYLRAAHWVSLPENRDAYFRFISDNSTIPLRFLERDFQNQDLADRFNPLCDENYVERLRSTVEFAYANGIVRNRIDVDAWVDRGMIRDALQELGIENFWVPWDRHGKPLDGAQAFAGVLPGTEWFRGIS
ncbi:putative aliphatic sulfonates-binding protein [compost metagenome]